MRPHGTNVGRALHRSYAIERRPWPVSDRSVPATSTARLATTLTALNWVEVGAERERRRDQDCDADAPS
jgi:hypothetical protein